METVGLLEKMIKHCEEQQKLQDMPDALVTFKVPRKAQRGRVRLFRDRGPLGDVMSGDETSTVGGFRADVVLEFLNREKARELSHALKIAGENLK